MRLPCAPALLGILTLVSGCTSTGTITGTLLGRDPTRSAPSGEEPLAGHVSAGRSIADAVVYVAEIDGEVDVRLPAPREPARIEQSGLAFRPRVLVVVAGTRVEFPNRDSVFHNVFSVSPVKPFDLGGSPPPTLQARPWAALRRAPAVAIEETPSARR